MPSDPSSTTKKKSSQEKGKKEKVKKEDHDPTKEKVVKKKEKVKKEDDPTKEKVVKKKEKVKKEDDPTKEKVVKKKDKVKQEKGGGRGRRAAVVEGAPPPTKGKKEKPLTKMVVEDEGLELYRAYEEQTKYNKKKHEIGKEMVKILKYTASVNAAIDLINGKECTAKKFNKALGAFAVTQIACGVAATALGVTLIVITFGAATPAVAAGAVAIGIAATSTSSVAAASALGGDIARKGRDQAKKGKAKAKSMGVTGGIEVAKGGAAKGAVEGGKFGAGAVVPLLVEGVGKEAAITVTGSTAGAVGGAFHIVRGGLKVKDAVKFTTKDLYENSREVWYTMLVNVSTFEASLSKEHDGEVGAWLGYNQQVVQGIKDELQATMERLVRTIDIMEGVKTLSGIDLVALDEDGALADLVFSGRHAAKVAKTDIARTFKNFAKKNARDPDTTPEEHFKKHVDKSSKKFRSFCEKEQEAHVLDAYNAFRVMKKIEGDFFQYAMQFHANYFRYVAEGATEQAGCFSNADRKDFHRSCQKYRCLMFMMLTGRRE